MASGYEQNYQLIAGRLAELDFAEAASRLGLDAPANGAVRISFLGRTYEIGAAGVCASDGLPSSPTHRAILVHYMTSKGSGDPEGVYCTLGHFMPGAISGGAIAWMTAPLVGRYGKDYPRFEAAMLALGAKNRKANREGEHEWSYAILPQIPMRVVYIEADDEFPCEIKLMMDAGAGRYLEFEQLAFLCGCLVERLGKFIS